MCTTAISAFGAEYSVLVDGKPVESDVPVVNVEGRVLVPVAELFRKLGGSVKWDESSRLVTITNSEATIEITIDELIAKVNGKDVTLDVPAKIINNRTYMPARFAADCFGAKTEWDDAAKTVKILTQVDIQALKSALQTAVDNIEPTYDMTINNPKLDIASVFAINDFGGVKKWEYSGTKDDKTLELVWKIQYTDAHAINQSIKNPNLKSKLNESQLMLFEKCESIISEIIKKGMTDYEKEKAIHDYLVLNLVYDEETLNNPIGGNKDSYTAYGALFNKTAVCSGYSGAASILLTLEGIENYELHSDTHSWNLVKIGEGYYHLDVTWDDPVPDRPEEVQYDFFNLTDAEMVKIKQHDWKDKEKYPKANAREYNYFVYSRIAPETYEQAVEIIKKAYVEGKSEITILLNEELKSYNWADELKFLFSLGANGISYSKPSESKNTLTVTFK